MNGDLHSTESSKLKPFLLTAVRLCKEHGFVTDDRIVGHFKPLNILRSLTDKERADILALSGLRGDASLALAGMDAAVWMPIVTASKVSAEAMVNSAGIDRIVEVLDGSALWSLSTEKSFWDLPKEDAGYKAARACIEGVVEEGFHLKLLTHKDALQGAIADALVVHLPTEDKASFANWLLSLASDGRLPDHSTIWIHTQPLRTLPLPILWEDLVIGKIVRPLGLLKAGTSGPESLPPWSSLGGAAPAAAAAPAAPPAEAPSADAPVEAPAAPPESEPAAPPAAPVEDARADAPVEAPVPPVASGGDPEIEAFERDFDRVTSQHPIPHGGSADPGTEPGGVVEAPAQDESRPPAPTRREGSGAPSARSEGTPDPKAKRAHR